MALVLTYEDAQRNQHSKPGSLSKAKIGAGNKPIRFFGSADTPDMPDAHLSERVAGLATRKVGKPHFHTVDQFQVVINGKGKIGRHDLAPYDVHFSRAYTPYGPIVSEAETGFTYFVLRAHYDPGAQFLPQSLDKLKQIHDRHPWQITSPAIFQTELAAHTQMVLRAIPGIKNDQGLAAYTINVKPNAKAYAPVPANGDGQYLVVVKGSLLHDNKECRALTLIFVGAKESPFQIFAGSEGLEAIALNFPRKQTGISNGATQEQTKGGLKRWHCTLCSFSYDEARGLPDDGIAPGTRWQDVPATWNCPDCSASKGDFEAAG